MQERPPPGRAGALAFLEFIGLRGRGVSVAEHVKLGYARSMTDEHTTEIAQRRDEVAKWLAANDPDPCDPIDYDASGYYWAYADALLASGWVVTPPGQAS